MATREPDILRKIQFFGDRLLEEIEKEREWDQLDREGKTWNVIHLDGTMIGRGVRGLELATGTEDSTLF